MENLLHEKNEDRIGAVPSQQQEADQGIHSSTSELVTDIT